MISKYSTLVLKMLQNVSYKNTFKEDLFCIFKDNLLSPEVSTVVAN